MLRLTTLLLLVLAAPAAAEPGDLDRTFGHHGRLAFAGEVGYSWATDALVRADGSADASFGTAGAVILGEDLYLSAIGVDGAGRSLIAGTRSPGRASVVMRLLPGGAPDPGYPALSLPEPATALLVQRDG